MLKKALITEIIKTNHSSEKQIVRIAEFLLLVLLLAAGITTFVGDRTARSINAALRDLQQGGKE